MPVLVGSSSLPDRHSGPASIFEFEMRFRLTRSEARVLQCLPIVGDCVRRWRVPVVPSKDWRPHPTMPGVEIQVADA
jgi:hypothetical protein